MKIKLIVLNIVLICCSTSFNFGFAQSTTTTPNYAPDLNVKQPEVASLLKFIETPVSYNSGLPNISIPIHTIKQGDITYPISIDYNASGVNVNERAGWVGMGFSINQPQVTRMIKGIADDKGGFIYETEYTIDKIRDFYIHSFAEWCGIKGYNTEDDIGNSIHMGEYGAYEDDIMATNFGFKQFRLAAKLATEGIIDLESDEYRVILPNGENIRFYFSQDRTTEFPYGKIIQIPITNNKITPIFTGSLITGWEVIGTDGFVYNFLSGNSTILTESYSIGGNDLPSLDGKGKDGNCITSWMLSKIKSPTNKELNFTYAPFIYNDCNQTNQRRNIMSSIFIQNFDNSVTTNYQKTIGFNYFLESIYGSFGRVNFNLDTDIRDDYAFGKKLNSITIYDTNLKKVNSFAFDYIFKTSPDPIKEIYTCGYKHEKSDLVKRMFLDKITILGNIDTSNVNKPNYSFSYNSTEMPYRFSFASDWWGYYNGAIDNKSLVPTRFRFDADMPNRNVDSNFSQAGLLTEIKFPTGGSTKYEFESNRGIYENPIVKRYHMLQSIGEGYIDGINIIPSIKTGINFNTLDYTPVSNTLNANGSRKLIYEKNFTVGDNVIGYHYGLLGSSNIMTINAYYYINAHCNNCIYPENSMPVLNGCSVYYKIMKNNVQINPQQLISGNHIVSGEFQVGDFNNGQMQIDPQEYKLVVEINTGHSTVFEEPTYNPDIDNVTIDFNWDIINPDLVTKIGDKYDMAVGGHRIKSIKTFENTTTLPLEKQYEYKDENGVESGFCNFRLTNFFGFADIFYLNSDNNFPLQFYHGQPVGYSFVKEKLISGLEKKISTYKYTFFPSTNGYGACYFFNYSYGNGGICPCVDNPSNGLLIENNIGSVRKISSAYTTPNPLLNTTYIKGYNVSNRLEAGIEPENESDYAKYSISNFYEQKPFQSISEEYFPTGTITTTTNNTYNTTNHLQLISQVTSTSTGSSETNYFYPQDLPNEPHASDLITQNRIATPLVTQTIKNGLKLAEQKTEYAKDSSTNNLLLPKFIYANKGAELIDTNADKRITYNQYDNKGNLLEYTLENGTPVAIIWGYNQTQPIAKIENAPYSAISSFVSNLQGLSNDDNDHCTTNPCTGNEHNLRIALNALRYEPALANAMITTYTYDPLIGVTSITDPKGETHYFNYDAFGRLENVKDKDGNILSENEYHYKP